MYRGSNGLKALIPEFQDALDFMMKNEGWRRIYENAPQGAKASLEYSFDSSYCAHTGKKRTLEEIKEIASKNPVKQTKEDWRYLIMVFPNTPARPYYEKRLLEAEE